MTNNKNKSRDEGSMLPVVAANLIANLFELATDPDLKTKGGEIRGLGRANKVSMALFESAFSSFIEMRSGLSPAGKTLAIQLVDNIFDALRRLPTDSDHATKISALEEGGRSAMATVKKVVGTATTKQSTFAPMLMKLSFNERTILHVWLRWLEEHDKAGFKSWNELKERISSAEELQEVVKRGAYGDMSQVTEARLSFLRMAYDRKPTALETLKKVIDGDVDNPHVKRLETKVSDFTTKADALAAKWAAEAAAIRAQNRR